MAKRRSNIHFFIKMDVYPFDILVSINQNDNQLGKILDRFNMSAEDISLAAYSSKNSTGLAAMFSTNQSIIRLPKLPETTREFGTLAHEIFHVAAFILDRIGMKLEIMKSDEAYAYLIGFITTRFYEETNKYY